MHYYMKLTWGANAQPSEIAVALHSEETDQIWSSCSDVTIE